MKDIFHDLYNKVLSFFTSQEEQVDPTKGVAVNRLKTVLLQDRAGFSERAIQMMREELVLVVSKYMEIDDENFQLQIYALENKTVLALSIPVIRPKTDDEIDETIKEQSLKNQKKAEEIVKELENLIKEKALALADGTEIDNELIEQARKNINDKELEDEAQKEEQETTESEDKKEENPEKSEEKEAAPAGTGSSHKKEKKKKQ